MSAIKVIESKFDEEYDSDLSSESSDSKVSQNSSDLPDEFLEDCVGANQKFVS